GPAHVLVLVGTIRNLNDAAANEVQILLVAEHTHQLNLLAKASLHDRRHLYACRGVEGAEDIGGLGMRTKIADGLLRQGGANLVARKVDRLGHDAASTGLHLGDEADLERDNGRELLVGEKRQVG